MSSPWNVLLILSDQHRRDLAGCYGHPLVRTPALDRLAADGLRYDRAFCPSPLCGPSRSAIVTGRHVHNCGAWAHRFMREPMDAPTLGEVFRSAGYATAAFGKLHVKGENDDRDLGFDERALRVYTPTKTDYPHAVGAEDFHRYEARDRHSLNPRNEPIDLPESRIMDTMVTDRCVDFMERRRDEPFLLWMGLDRPHPAWFAPRRFHEMYDPDDMPLPESIWASKDHLPRSIRDNPQFPVITREAMSDRELRCCIAAYCACITYTDYQVGRALDALDRLGLAERTIVVYSTDHGDNLFEHGLVHKHCFYEPSVRVPLIVRAPGRVPANETREEPVNLIDLLPTLAELCGVDAPENMDGRSLTDTIRAPGETGRDAVFSEFYEWGTPERMIRTDRYKYVHSRGDRHQLYDLREDPNELVNLTADPAYADLCRELDERVTDGWTFPDPETLGGVMNRG